MPHEVQLLQEQQTPPQFPQCGINVTPNGVLISIILAPGLSLNQAIDENTMNQICQKWLETRREIKKQQEMIANVMRSKN